MTWQSVDLQCGSDSYLGVSCKFIDWAGTGDENTFGQLTYYQNDQKLGNAMEALREQREQGRYCDAVLLVGAKQLKVRGQFGFGVHHSSKLFQ